MALSKYELQFLVKKVQTERMRNVPHLRVQIIQTFLLLISLKLKFPLVR